jgi:hypothetical protein
VTVATEGVYNRRDLLFTTGPTSCLQSRSFLDRTIMIVGKMSGGQGVSSDIDNAESIDSLGGWGSRFLLRAEEAEIHRRTYIAIIDSFIPAAGGRAGLARRAGISEAFLSYIRSWNYVRNPSPTIARRIADSLPAPQEIRESLLRHIELSRYANLEALQIARYTTESGSSDGLVQQMAIWHAKAYSAKEPFVSRRLYSAVCESAKIYLKATHPSQNTPGFLKVCSLLSDSLITLNRPDQALFIAGIARAMSNRLVYRQDARFGYRIQWNEINSMRSIGGALHNLGLEKAAIAQYEEARYRAQQLKLAPPLWEPYLISDIIKASAGLPRFSVRELRAGRERAIRLLDNDRQLGDLWRFMISEALVRAYLRSNGGSPTPLMMRSAINELDQLMDLLNMVAGIGPLHQVFLYNTTARLHRIRRDKDGWVHFASMAYQIATSGGLIHQASKILKENDGLSVQLKREDGFSPSMNTQTPIARSLSSIPPTPSKLDDAPEIGVAGVTIPPLFVS